MTNTLGPERARLRREWLAMARRLRDRREPCGCTPTQECDRHYLDADDQFRRVMDRD